MSDQTLWIGTSWKMNKSRLESVTWARRLTAARLPGGLQPFVIPPYTSIAPVHEVLRDTSVMVGAQNMHWADAGAWTGEISPLMVRDVGAMLVELGHSERRIHFGETNEQVGLKVEAAVRHGLIPLVCIGESHEQKIAGRADEHLETQVRTALSRIGECDGSPSLLLAYEPVWSIGEQGVPATTDYAEDRQAHIADVANSVLGRSVPCLYGGSVDSANCRDYLYKPHIDGLFIGRSAWSVEGYLEILGLCAEAANRV